MISSFSSTIWWTKVVWKRARLVNLLPKATLLKNTISTNRMDLRTIVQNRANSKDTAWKISRTTGWAHCLAASEVTKTYLRMIKYKKITRLSQKCKLPNQMSNKNMCHPKLISKIIREGILVPQDQSTVDLPKCKTNQLLQRLLMILSKYSHRLHSSWNNHKGKQILQKRA